MLYGRLCVCVYGIFFSAISLNGLAVSISLLANSFRICFFLNFPFTRFHLDVDDVLTWLVCSCHLLYTLFFFLSIDYFSFISFPLSVVSFSQSLVCTNSISTHFLCNIFAGIFHFRIYVCVCGCCKRVMTVVSSFFSSAVVAAAAASSP